MTAPQAWVEIDLAAIRHNLANTRRAVGPAVRIYAVCKGDAYGCGLIPVARTALAGGADAIAVGNPDEAERLRADGITAPILLYGSADGKTTADIARLGVTVTVFDLEGLHALARAGHAVEAFAKLDCGFGRMGFTPEAWATALDAFAAAPDLALRGLYTHIGALEDRDLVASQVACFGALAAQAEHRGLHGLQRMIASSRVLIGAPKYHFTAVNPGRLLYGLLDDDWSGRFPVMPAIRAVKSRVIQVKTLPPGSSLGYGAAGRRDLPMTTAVLPIGFAGGLPRVFRDGYGLVRGQRAPIVGLASMEHLLVDVTRIGGVEVGDEFVLLGGQGTETIRPADLERMTGLEGLEILSRLARSLPRIYAGEQGAA